MEALPGSPRLGERKRRTEVLVGGETEQTQSYRRDLPKRRWKEKAAHGRASQKHRGQQSQWASRR